MTLTNEQRKTFEEALKDAFRTYNSLKRMLRNADKSLESLVGTGALDDVVPDLIDKAEEQGWLQELLDKATEENPGNPKLKAFKQSLQSKEGNNTSAHQAMINPFGDGFSDVEALKQLRDSLPTKICRIDFGANAQGTGFLVGTDLVLTNYHVIEDVNEGKYSYKNVYCRFDYKNEGEIENLGETYALANNWLKAYSIDSNADNSIDDEPDINELDYALLKLAKSPQRGFIEMPDDEPLYEPQTKLTIIQHPEGVTLKEATGNILGVNSNKTRLFYDTQTEPGSSGSPCFNAQMQLIALHNSGIPRKRNAGIPIMRIKENLEEKGIILSTEGANPSIPIDINPNTPKEMEENKRDKESWKDLFDDNPKQFFEDMNNFLKDNVTLRNKLRAIKSKFKKLDGKTIGIDINEDDYDVEFAKFQTLLYDFIDKL